MQKQKKKKRQKPKPILFANFEPQTRFILINNDNNLQLYYFFILSPRFNVEMFCKGEKDMERKTNENKKNILTQFFFILNFNLFFSKKINNGEAQSRKGDEVATLLLLLYSIAFLIYSKQNSQL